MKKIIILISCISLLILDCNANHFSLNDTSTTQIFSEFVVNIEKEKKEKKEKKGLDERIDDAFMPIAVGWEGFIFTGISYEKSEVIDLKVTIDTLKYSSLYNYYKEFADINKLGFSGKDIGDSTIIYTVDTKEEIAGIKSLINNLEGVKNIEVVKAKLPIVIILLVFGALFFTFYFSFPGIKRFGLAINTVRGKYDDIDSHTAEKSDLNIDGDIKGTIKDESKEGEVSHFQALATAVSGTVGLGNIAGVAVAIALGGPGATFWMIICGIIGMSTKFVECTLGVKYRDVGEDGTVYGGPMYYLKKGLEDKGMKTLGKILGVLFAVLCVGASFGGGNAFQSNQATVQISSMLGVTGGSSGFMIGLILAVLVGIVIIGGIKRIAKITEKIVPFMAGIYVLASLIIISLNYTYIDDAFKLIYEGAFTPMAGLGGIIGVIIVGFQRAAFSNEAGAGSAAIAHSAVKTKYPASEGVVALLEPFIDTVVICTMTALVIIFFNINEGEFSYGKEANPGSGVLMESDTHKKWVKNKFITIDSTKVDPKEKEKQRLILAQIEKGHQHCLDIDPKESKCIHYVGGVNLTSKAYDSAIPGFSYILTLAIILFAFSTMISWSYYGLQSWKYLFGRGRRADLMYKILFLLFIIIGASATLDAVIKFSDAMILALVFPNMIGLLLLFPEVKKELARYLKAIGK